MGRKMENVVDLFSTCDLENLFIFFHEAQLEQLYLFVNQETLKRGSPEHKWNFIQKCTSPHG